jgi:hypothetical protein
LYDVVVTVNARVSLLTLLADPPVVSAMAE